MADPQVSWLQQQVQRLDPANRSLCFKGLKQDNPETRKHVIEALLDSVDLKSEIIGMEHIYTGPPTDRKISPISVVELGSRNARENALKKLVEPSSLLKSEANSDLIVQRAKTASQRKRNTSLVQACDLSRKDPRVRTKSSKIPGRKRELQIDMLK